MIGRAQINSDARFLMTALKLKWWMLDSGGTLFSVPSVPSAFEGEGMPYSRGIVLAGSCAIRDFSYKAYWQLYVDFMPMEPFRGVSGNCRILLARDFGAERLSEMFDFVRLSKTVSDVILAIDRVYRIERIGLGQTTSGSRGRVVETADGADLTLS